jgi:hypothetical protein
MCVCVHVCMCIYVRYAYVLTNACMYFIILVKVYESDQKIEAVEPTVQSLLPCSLLLPVAAPFDASYCSVYQCQCLS